MLFIDINKLIKKIRVIDWLSLRNVSFEKINQYSKTILRGWLYKIVFKSIWQ